MNHENVIHLDTQTVQQRPAAPTAADRASDVVAAGAQRAAAERRRSRGNPLLRSADRPEPAQIDEQVTLESPPPGLSDDRDEVIEHQIASAAAFLRRRLHGDFTVDEFGFDEEFSETVALGMLRLLYRHWFRVEVRGIENIPDHGGALIVSNHSGTIALDCLMEMVAIHDEHPKQRHLRMLGADIVFKTPVLGSLARKVGVTLAAHEDANRLLREGHLVGVWPEGYKGIGKLYRERYRLQRFGRGGFVAAALKTRTPIIPCSIVGAEEIYPMVGNMGTLARLLGMPYLPVTPTWPLLGPLGLVPLPSKWMIEFGAPIYTDTYPPGAEDDPMLVFDLTDRVRETIQETLYSLLVARRNVFF